MSEIKTTKIIGETGVDAVNFTSGLNVTGVSTATNVSTASSVTAGTFYGNGAGLTNVTAGLLLRKTAYDIPRQSIGHASFPLDDTIPQISEGTQFFSQAYTPSTANCDLYIYCSAGIRERTNVADDVGMALFISDQTDALRVVTGFMQGYGHGEHLHLYHKMPSWGVSAKTFSLRSHKANSVNFQALYGGYPSEKFSAAASGTLFIIEEVST
tara:strand:+ start:883 stop:1518 length:636 start_codon:yes stop_codon:yes gene_type:complete